MDEFLRRFFGNAITPEHRLALFTLPGFHASHAQSIEEAVAWATGQDQRTENVYFGPHLVGQRFDAIKNSNEDVVVVLGLHVDLDAVGPGRDEKPLPSTWVELHAFVTSLPHPPTLVNVSGYGVHAFWKFNEPWELEDARERGEARRLLLGWHAHVCALGKLQGWEWENCGDLSRVLRLPGTYNRKGPEPRLCETVEYHPELAYHPDHFQDFVPPEPKVTVSVGDVVLEAEATPPPEKLQRLLEHSPRARSIWSGMGRTGGTDHSPSGDDLALLCLGAFAEWTDQELANLSIAWRRKHGFKPEKALRPDYLRRTIGRARRHVAEQGIGGIDLNFLLQATGSAPPTNGNGTPSPWPDALPWPEFALKHPHQDPPLIHGLFRQGEIMNLISESKIGKSWLGLDLLCSLALGTPWLGFPCEPVPVLLLDNELRPGSITHRLAQVAQARGHPPLPNLRISSVRGRRLTLDQLLAHLDRQYEREPFHVVLLDAFYRLLPKGTDENSNADIAALYNHLDELAERYLTGFILIHHSSKGTQAFKSVTDVGSGAGAQSRATDTHLILRRHKDPGVIVLDAAARTWVPIQPRCLRWTFPLWLPAPDLNPEELHVPGQKKGAKDDPTVDDLVGCLGEKPLLPRDAVLQRAARLGWTQRATKALIDEALDLRVLFRWPGGYLAQMPRPKQMAEVIATIRAHDPRAARATEEELAVRLRIPLDAFQGRLANPTKG